jgi:SAM-dependent methyltransferase
LKLATVHGHRGRLIGYEIPIGSFEDRFYAAWDIMQRSGIYNISFRKGYAQDLDEPDSSIDVLLAFNLLYEIPNPEQALSEFYRVTKPGGKLAFITNAEGNRSRTHYYLGRIGEYLGVQAPAPRSSRFNYAKAKIVIPRYFKVIKENEQDSTRLLSVDDVITGLDTYFPLFGVETKGYLEAREKVRREIEEDARVNSGNITEIVKLGSFICINEKAA